MPRNVKQAIAKGTRSLNGMPGPHYWQNRGRYTISIIVQPPSRAITGHETITYYNNSPDTLRYLILRLILNVHKPEALRYMDVDSNWFTDGTVVDRVLVNGRTLTLKIPGIILPGNNYLYPMLYFHTTVCSLRSTGISRLPAVMAEKA